MSFSVEIRESHELNAWTGWPSSRDDDDWTTIVVSDIPMDPLTRNHASPTFALPGPTYTDTFLAGLFPSTAPSTIDPSPAQETAGTTLYKSTGPPEPNETSPSSSGTDGSSTVPSGVPLSTTLPQNEDSSQHSKVIKHVAAAVIPLACLAILGVILFLYIRRRRRQKHQTLVQKEMKRHSPDNYSPAAEQQAYYHHPSGTPPPALSPMPPQPVILGPIAPNSNGAYYTGIDTSDVVSMHETHPPPQPTGLGNPFVDPQHEEPPPPYRPRSLAPLSRNTSLRSPPPAALSQTNLMAAQEQTRSPFSDHHDDDNISEFSATAPHYGRRAVDELSVVSDLSYQQDPVVNRPSV
ncbi:uncharacterized protein BDZ99DRAFT_457681 [Mytilinidion resinicola]|uniref:Uncharacterized protein n=1 Tax=Mytilinidion resinicola TaxID=574789 RepID=A0A6A6Z5Z3_9PEZI|nr:uncharacterized protein BDZ99DRAFT_457681 [Mytilinidion resinicola]KAF2815714.1 hypothetical protein BDZ99DRAFT_457681 [Mytilinidion resinicola]